jgi:tRNA (guanine37-N1)-methyltransferase
VRFDLLTLHPDLVQAPLHTSVLGRAVTDGTIEVGVHNLREHGLGKHRVVDDTPYGGGPGMVMRADVVAAGIASVRRPESRVLLMSAAGTRFDQAMARRLSAEKHLVLVCGHYEGIDARVEPLCDELVSIGDFVLTGGELAAMVIVDAVARLVPGVLGNEQSPVDESFTSGLLEYPQYTRPREFQGVEVPEILLSGHHAQIEAWRRAQSEDRTRVKRPDLWAAYQARASVQELGGVDADTELE